MGAVSEGKKQLFGRFRAENISSASCADRELTPANCSSAPTESRVKSRKPERISSDPTEFKNGVLLGSNRFSSSKRLVPRPVDYSPCCYHGCPDQQWQKYSRHPIWNVSNALIRIQKRKHRSLLIIFQCCQCRNRCKFHVEPYLSNVRVLAADGGVCWPPLLRTDPVSSE